MVWRARLLQPMHWANEVRLRSTTPFAPCSLPFLLDSHAFAAIPQSGSLLTPLIEAVQDTKLLSETYIEFLSAKSAIAPSAPSLPSTFQLPTKNSKIWNLASKTPDEALSRLADYAMNVETNLKTQKTAAQRRGLTLEEYLESKNKNKRNGKRMKRMERKMRRNKMDMPLETRSKMSTRGSEMGKNGKPTQASGGLEGTGDGASGLGVKMEEYVPPVVAAEHSRLSTFVFDCDIGTGRIRY